MRNPWPELPKKPPHILPQDLEDLKKANTTPERLGFRLEVFPVPYVGDPNKAKVVLLGLNPGFIEHDIEVYETDPEFNRQSLKTLTFSSNPPFFYFNNKFTYTGGYKWWSKILGECIRKFGLDTVSEKFMCLQYIPYHSVTFKNSPKYLESQKFTFSLLAKAIDQKKVVVIMRSKKLWLKAVPKLEGYPYIELKNYRRPFISKNNMAKGDFDRLIGALTS